MINGNFRIVPEEKQNLPPCNEIFRGMLAILEVEVECNEDDVCERDAVFMCMLRSNDYEWVMVSDVEAKLYHSL